MCKRFITQTALLFVAITAFSQKPAKWGDVPAADLKMTVYTADSAAAAVVLQDIGQLEYIETNEGFLLVFSQHRRIKVFDQSAFKEGNVFIPYYSGDRIEKFRELDVQVFAPDGSKTKVSTDNVFTEKLSRNWSAKKVFVPNLQKGCVIEYRFRIESKDWVTLRDWYFQDPELPTRWSELTLDAPGFFDYVTLTKGNYTYDVDERHERNDYFNGSSQQYQRRIRRMGLKNLPALKPEPYVTTIDDYRAGVSFQLRTINPPDRTPIPVMVSWTNLAEQLSEQAQFGQQYLRGGNSDRLWAAFKAEHGPLEGLAPEVLMSRALSFVSANMRWNGEYRVTTDDKLDEAFAKKTGSTADLNLAVVALLRRAEVPALPLLVSTRSHGACHPEFPLMDQFNAVVAFVPEVPGSVKGRVLDASSAHHPPGLAQEEIYNYEGWLAQKDQPRWIALNAPESAEAYTVTLSLNPEGVMQGHVTLQMTGHLARDFRETLGGKPAPEALASRFSGRFPEATVDSVRIENLSQPAQPVKADFFVRLPNSAQLVNDFIYCTPVVAFFFEENPFKSLKRLYPVNFPYPLRAHFSVNLLVPAGYKVEETPENLSLSLPNDGGKLVYTVVTKPDGNLQISLRVTLKQLDFLPEEYESLRFLFDRIVAKMTEQIVLRKI